MPTWGDKWNRESGAGPEVFTPENAEAYGRWLGQRYRDAGVIWIVGGHHSVWQMWTAERPPINNPLLPWQEAIDQPGAAQMQHGRALMESRPFLTRLPDPSVLVATAIPTAMPGTGRYHFAGTRDQAGTYVMVYAPVGRTFRVRMSAITGPRVRAWWFNPRTGAATTIGTPPPRGTR